MRKLDLRILRNVSGFYRPQRSCEGYVFTRVCHSVHRGEGACSRGGRCSWSKGCVSALGGSAWTKGGCLVWGGAWSPGGLLLGGWYPSMHWGRPPWERRLLLWTVRILLECILVKVAFIFFVQNVTLTWAFQYIVISQLSLKSSFRISRANI